MVGYFTRVLPLMLRGPFITAGVMLLLPHQVAELGCRV